MSNVIIHVDTGFVGGIHEVETHLTVEEWNELSTKAQNEWLMEAMFENIETYAVDEETGEPI